MLRDLSSCITVCRKVCVALLQEGCRAGCTRGGQQARMSTLPLLHVEEGDEPGSGLDRMSKHLHVLQRCGTGVTPG